MYVLRQFHPAIGVCEVGDRPYEEKQGYQPRKDIEETGLILLLHVNAVGNYEDVERDGEPQQKGKHTNRDPKPAIIDAA